MIISIPKLELLGAIVGTRLVQGVMRVLVVPMSQVIFWCDSTNVLWWIKGCSRTYKPFVANRIGKIQSASSPNQWRYVPTDLNPAGFLTRGLQVSELICKKSWWGGPDYLHGDEEAWPENKISGNEEAWPENEVSGNVSPHAMEEVKRKYQEVSNSCGTSILSGEAQGLTMVGVEKPACWRLNPERYSSYIRG